MNWQALWAQIVKLNKKIDDMDTIELKKVEELPETGEPNTFYLVPKATAEEGNYSDEYIWDAGLEEFEKVGDTMITPESVKIFKGNENFRGSQLYITLLDNKKALDIINALRENFIVIITGSNNACYNLYSITESNNKMVTAFCLFENMSAYKSFSVSEWQPDTTSFVVTRTYFDTQLSSGSNRAPQTKVVKAALDLKANISDIPTVPADYTKDTATAPLYDSTATYAVGDICMYQKELYKCNTAIDPAEEWDSTHWTKTDILSEMPIPVPAVTDYAKDSSVAPLYDSTATYALGDLVMHDKELYKCTTAISTAEAWDSTHWTKTDVVDEIPDGLPAVTSSDNGKMLGVVNGDWNTVEGYSVNVTTTIYADPKSIWTPTTTFGQLSSFISSGKNIVFSNSNVEIYCKTSDSSFRLGIKEISNDGFCKLDLFKPYNNMSNTKTYYYDKTIITSLPKMSSSDEGKVLTVDSNGNWVAAESEATTALRQQY